jgi:hypothetical protein
MGGYVPKKRQYGDWAFGCIHRNTSRVEVASWLRTIKRESGREEARAFSNYLSWLGAWPVVNGARWVNRYGRSPVQDEGMEVPTGILGAYFVK